MENIKSFINANNITITSLSVPYNPAMTDSHKMFNWVVCLGMGAKIFNVPFSTGGGHIELNPKAPRFIGGDYTPDNIKKAKENINSIYYDFEIRAYRTYGKSTVWLNNLYAMLFQPKPPTAETVLECLKMEASVLDYACFEYWACDFGYDTDSISAKNTYEACIKNALQLRAFLGDKYREFMDLENE